MLCFTLNGVAQGQAQARFASPWASLANLVLRRWLAYLPAPVTIEALGGSTHTLSTKCTIPWTNLRQMRNLVLKNGLFKDDHGQKCEFVLKIDDFKDELHRQAGHHRRNVRYPPVTGRAGMGGSAKGPPCPLACCLYHIARPQT